MPRRVRAHIHLCILGYFPRQLLKLKMDGGGVGMSVREALMRLRRVRSVTIASGDVVLAKHPAALDPCQERLPEPWGVTPT